MAIKDLSPTIIADILILISQVNDYKSAAIKNAKDKLKRGWSPRFSKIIGASNPGGIKTWYNDYIAKSAAPAAGTSTFSTAFVSTTEYSTIFYTVRTALASIPQDGATVKALAALDKWWKSMDVRAELGYK